MDKYCKEACLKHFEKCLKHFGVWNNIMAKLEIARQKHNSTLEEYKQTEMQSTGLTENLIEENTNTLIRQICREVDVLIIEVENLELTIDDLKKIKPKVLEVPLNKCDDIDVRFLLLFEDLYTSATSLAMLLRECFRNVELKDPISMNDISEATKILEKCVDGFEVKLNRWKTLMDRHG